MTTEVLKNPFEIKPPEELSAELIQKLFVKEYTEYNALIGNYHTFIFGSRGSGKSMHFRFLEPKCQIIDYGGIKEFFESESPFIGVYINCNKGDFTKTDFSNLISSKETNVTQVKKMLTHYFVMDIADCTLKTYIEQLDVLLDESKEEKVFEKVINWLGGELGGKKTLNELRKVIYGEKKKIDNSFNEYQQNYGLPENRIVSKSSRLADVSLDENSFLHTLFNSLRDEIINKNIPYYLLFDEANELLDFQKEITNTLISQRKHSLASIKVSCQPLSYKIFTDLKDRHIQETHDYYFVDLDSLYTTDKFSYYNRLKQIAEKRLDIAGFKVKNISELIPENPEDLKKKKESEAFTAKEYDKLPENKKPISKTNYIRKYSMARFFQLFLKKTSYSYTGFDNLVHFSSGIIRSFLQPCFLMIEKHRESNPSIDIKEIKFLSYEVQRNIIEKYSSALIEAEIIRPMRLEPQGSEKRKILVGLNNLIESLCIAFKMRLNDKKSREPRIISFSVKESVRDDNLQKILDYSIQKAFFHPKWYRAKSGNEILECFILNRRLCPRFQLDLSSFQGRFEISQDLLLVAINDLNEFKKLFVKEKLNEEIIQLELFDF